MDLEVISKLLLMQTLLQRTLYSPSLHAVLCLVAQSCLTLCDPMDCSPPGSSVHGDSPGKNTGVGCHALFQGIFLTQGSNLRLLHLLLWQAPGGAPEQCAQTGTTTHNMRTFRCIFIFTFSLRYDILTIKVTVLK